MTTIFDSIGREIAKFQEKIAILKKAETLLKDGGILIEDFTSEDTPDPKEDRMEGHLGFLRTEKVTKEDVPGTLGLANAFLVPVTELPADTDGVVEGKGETDPVVARSLRQRNVPRTSDPWKPAHAHLLRLWAISEKMFRLRYAVLTTLKGFHTLTTRQLANRIGFGTTEQNVRNAMEPMRVEGLIRFVDKMGSNPGQPRGIQRFKVTQRGLEIRNNAKWTSPNTGAHSASA